MRTLTREQILSLSGLALHHPDTLPAAQDLVLQWLRTYPGDLQVQAAYARILLARGQPEAARHIAARISRADPWDETFYRLHIQTAGNSLAAQAANACLRALDAAPFPDIPLPAWGAALAQTRAALRRGDVQGAQEAFQEAAAVLSHVPLAACIHLQLLGAQFPSSDDEAHCALPITPPVQHALQQHYARWPDCLPLALWYAEQKLACGQEAGAVAILHRCATQDVGGQTPKRIWGEQHPYKALWPSALSLPLEIALPAALNASLGWNQLPKAENLPFGEQAAPSSGEKAPPQAATTPKGGVPSPRALPGKRNFLHPREHVYVLLTTQRGLEAQYGAPQSRRVLAALQRLEHTLQAHFRGGALLLVVDSAQSMARLGLPPATPDDAWSIKLTLQDVREHLRTRGKDIGALLIAGGPQVVPFHHLPNPVSDDDPHIPTDAPYASLDADFFAWEWPTGRLPGDATRRASVLIAQIEALHDRYAQPPSRGTWLWEMIRQWQRRLRTVTQEEPMAMGYTAAIWWRASLEVLSPIGSATDLLASPPILSSNFIGSGLAQARAGYFNLHGRVDAPEWFGQCDPRRECAEDFPVALRPQDVSRLGGMPRVVLSEACYGAHLEGRALEDSVALQFLAHGAHALIGSTTLAYGAISNQLIAADLLSERFWRALQRGLPAGEALQAARLAMAAELKRRQGVLDAEDRKALMSFVLLGDPMAQVFPQMRWRRAKSVSSPVEVPSLHDGEAAGEMLSDEAVMQVKQMMRQYLPGMRNADWSLRSEEGHLHAKSSTASARRKVLIFRKALPGAQQRQYVRVTLDEHERVTRLAVSR